MSETWWWSLLPRESARPAHGPGINIPLICAFVAFVGGVVFRGQQYLSNRPLWLDESSLALNVLQRSFAHLVQPLDGHQVAPIGFLLLSKLATICFGSSELALRAFPFVAGLAACSLFWRLAQRTLSQTPGAIAVALFATSGPLVYYSSEFKQYSSDVAWMVGLYLLALRIQEACFDGRAILLYGLVGAVSVWFSYPAVLVLSGTSVAIAVEALIAKRFRDLARYVGASGLWTVSFLVLYKNVLRWTDQSGDLGHFWSWAFMPLPPRSIADLKWFPDTFFKVFESPGGLTLVGLASLLFLVGLAHMFRRAPVQASVLSCPVLITLGASGMHLYPFFGRFILFLAPVLYLFIAEGCECLRKVGESVSRRYLWVFAIALLMFHPALEGIYHLTTPRANVGGYVILEDTRPLVQYFREHRRSEDHLVVYWGALPAYLYYTHGNGWQESREIRILTRGDWTHYAAELDQLKGQGRVWILFSHLQEHPADESFVRFWLGRFGREITSIHRVGARLYLYELSPQT